VHYKWKRGGNTKNFRIAGAALHRLDSLLCLNSPADMSYFAQAAALMMRQYTGVQLRKEDRGMNA
jgi:hypothetical protein